MGCFICAKCGCVDNTATSEYWSIVTRLAPDAEWDESLLPYKWKPLCSECCKIEFDETGNHARYVVNCFLFSIFEVLGTTESVLSIVNQ